MTSDSELMDSPVDSIPKGWTIATIGDIAEVVGGSTPSTEVPQFWDGDIPFVIPRDITENEFLNTLTTTERSITEEGFKAISSGLVPSGSVLVTSRATIGFAVISENSVATNQGILSLICGAKVQNSYLLYAIRFQKRKLEQLSTGTTFKEIPRKIMKRFKLPLPPLPEQNVIAEILDTVDSTIIQTQQLIEKIRAIKSGLLHDLLTRGIGKDGQVRKQVAIESDDASWESRKFGELFQLKHGYAFKSEYFDKTGSYIVLTPGNFFEEGGFKHKGEEEKHYIGEFPKDFILEKDDLIVAMTEQSEGLLGATAFIPESNKYLHNQRLGLVVNLDKTHLSKKFLDILFNYPIVRKQIQRTAAGTKVRHTSPDRIYKVEVMIPPIMEQLRIVDIISSVNKRIQQEEKYCKKMIDIKMGLMHDLLTGQVRVKVSKEKNGGL